MSVVISGNKYRKYVWGTLGGPKWVIFQMTYALSGSLLTVFTSQRELIIRFAEFQPFVVIRINCFKTAD